MNGELVAYCKAQGFLVLLPLSQFLLLHVTK